MGIKVGQPELDLPAMMKFKDDGVDGNVKGVAFLFKKNKIETFQGAGRIAAPGKVEVKAADGTAQALGRVPKRLLVVGAGVIGLELGSVWRRLGAQVIVVEFLDRILPGMDGEVCRQFQRMLEKQGIAFKLSSKVASIDTSGNRLKAQIEPAAGGATKPVEETIEADVALVAVGRVPFTEGLGLDAVGVKKDNRGRVIVDAHFATSVA